MRTCSRPCRSQEQGERLRGCRHRAGGPAQPRRSEQLEAGRHRQLHVLKTGGGPPAPQPPPLVQREHPNSGAEAEPDGE